MALILAASQDFEVSHQLAQALARLRHSVVATSTVKQAVVWLEQALVTPQLIIADVGLKAFGGLEFVQNLKAAEKWRNIPVLVQTKSQRCEIFDFCDGAVRKPWSTGELIQAVDLVLAVHVGGKFPAARPEAPDSPDARDEDHPWLG